MSYGYVYVAQCSMGSDKTQLLNALIEAEKYDGPSLIIAYSHCISHGYDIGKEGLDHQKLAVETGLWPLFRFDPRRADQGLNPFQLDSKPTKSIAEFMELETRFKVVKQSNPDHYNELVQKSQEQVEKRFKLYERLAQGE